MQMNDDFSTLNCFVSSLCWLHKYWRRSVFIFCNFVIVLPKKRNNRNQQQKGKFHLVNPLIATAAPRGFVRKCFVCFLSLNNLFACHSPWGSSSLLTLTNYLTKWKSSPLFPHPPLLTTEHTVANESPDGCYWNGLIIFMCSWKYHWVRWRRFRLCLLPLVLWNFAFMLMSEWLLQ